MDLSPDVGAGDVDGGVLPDPALGACQAADVEAIELDQIARMVGFQVHGFGRARFLGTRRRGVAGDQGQAPQAGVESMPAQDFEDEVGRDRLPAPFCQPELGGHPPGPQPGVTQGECDDPGFQPWRHLVGHPRQPPLPWTQDLQAVADNHASPAVVGRAVVAVLPAGLADSHLGSSREQTLTMPEKHVIMGHGRVLL